MEEIVTRVNFKAAVLKVVRIPKRRHVHRAVRAGNVAVDVVVAKKLDDSIQLFVSATITVIFVKVTFGILDRKSGCPSVAITLQNQSLQFSETCS